MLDGMLQGTLGEMGWQCLWFCGGHRLLGPPPSDPLPRVADSIGPGLGLRILISQKFLGNADAAGLRRTGAEPLSPCELYLGLSFLSFIPHWFTLQWRPKGLCIH